MLMLLRRLLLMLLNPKKLLPFLFPGFLGFLFSIFLFYTTNYNFLNSPTPYWRRTQIPRMPDHNLILVGVMTAEKYLDSRALQIWRSWAKKIPGHVIFFVAEGTKISDLIRQSGMPIVSLKGTDDSYPPQKKSFSMIRWMYDNELANFHWFMRADDDLFVRSNKLKSFLHSLDPDKAHLIGQAGLGNSCRRQNDQNSRNNSFEYGQLSLGAQDNYCMGGPGVILSRETLRQLAPHLQSCLGQLFTTHEDVELGRCIRRHVGLACPWNYEMQTLFHNNASIAAFYSKQTTSIRNFLPIRRLITLHPIKQPKIMQRIHLQAEIIRLKEFRQKRMEIVEQLETIERRRAFEGVTEMEQKEFGPNRVSPIIDGTYLSGLIHKQPKSPEELPIWEFISTDSKLLFCTNRPNCPRHTLEAEWRRAINNVIIELFDQFNANARQKGRTLHFQTLQYGHTRVQSKFGVDMILDIALWYRRFRSPNRHPPLAVRRHAYVQQRFGQLKSRHYSNDQSKPIIHIIVALKGRAETFERFAKNLVELNKEDGKIELILVHYSTPDNHTIDGLINATIDQFPNNFVVHKIEMPTQKEFNRGEALSKGAAIVPQNSLLFFADVDVLIRKDALDRIRLNTIWNRQAYFPIVFSEFSPHTWYSKGEETHKNGGNSRAEEINHFVYDQRRGYFRHFGFGIMAIYRTDFDAIGGFNLTIQGWGLEDVDLFERIVKEESKLQIFRAPDPGLVHVFHPIECKAKTGQQQTKAQREACEGTSAQSIASIDYLAQQLSPYL